MRLYRYKVQQDKGRYCLKECDDGDLVDYSEYAALESRLAAVEKDAARWRFARSWPVLWRGTYDFGVALPTGADEVIDAEIAAQQVNSPG